MRRSDNFQLACSEFLLASPLFPVAAGMVCGVVVASTTKCSINVLLTGLILSTLLLSISTTLRSGHPATLWGIIFIGGLCAGGILERRANAPPPLDSVAYQATEWGRFVRLRGTVVDRPTVRAPSEEWLGPFWRWMHAQTHTNFLMDVDGGETDGKFLAASGRVRVTVSEAMLDLEAGERVEILGELLTLSPARSRNPGSFNWGEYLRRQGVVARLACDGAANVRRIDRIHDTLASQAVEAVRRWSTAWLTNDLAKGEVDDANFLNVMVLGHRSEFDRKLDRAFSRCGAAHFVAVSGSNVAMLMSAVWLACRCLRWNRRRGAWLMLTAVVLYSLATEPRAPILRATVIGVLYCLSLILRKPTSGLNWLSAAAIVLIVIDPQSIFDAGFQLSFVAVLGVTQLAPAMSRCARDFRLGVAQLIRRVSGESDAVDDDDALSVSAKQSKLNLSARAAMRTVREVFIVSTSAWLATLPITLHYFQHPQLWGPISTIILWPLMTAMMTLGGLKILIAPLSSTLAGFVGRLLSWIDVGIVRCVDLLSALPGAGLVWRPLPALVIGLYYISLTIFILHFAGKYREARRKDTKDPLGVMGRPAGSVSLSRATVAFSYRSASRWMLIFSFSMTFVAWAYWRTGIRPREELRITVLAVGAGLATVLKLPDGSVDLYDAGSSGSYDVGTTTIQPYLRNEGVDRVARAYISHADTDHFSGLPGLQEELEIGEAIINPMFRRGVPIRSAAHSLLQFLETHGTPVREMDLRRRKWSEGGAEFELLWPEPSIGKELSDNDSSTVFRVSYKGHSILLTGDIEDFAQRALLSQGDLHADVLVLPHHGSVRRSTKEFIEAVGATILIRSSGQAMAATVNGLPNLVNGEDIFNTADMGAITVVLDAGGVRTVKR
ncbi:MAG: ComEC/Rec2 family competence protein [Planctomycetes bacterium]|nr:ComEC/Rec2 family competence protein [Planctomycetota bacterium]MBI3832938.1 ComEC/Rec2 family competence protein [Planctomycetota bacterium]